MKKWAPRFSLLTVLLLTALLACGITIWLLWRELVPLRAEVRGYRSELGHLTIDDPTRVHGIQVPTRQRRWKWRLYFPPGGNYTLRCYTGIIPPGVDAPQRNDFQSMKPGAGGSSTSFAGVFDGEKIIEARLTPVKDDWHLEISVGGGGWSYLRLDKEFAKYLSDPRSNIFLASNLNLKDQTSYAPGERVFLVKVRKLDVVEVPGGITTSEAKGPVPGVAMWIE